MPHPKAADTSPETSFETLREQALALRGTGHSRRRIRDLLHINNNDLLNRLLEGAPPPEWTKRPNAKDDLRARARELRLRGLTYDQIQIELGCSKGSISLWVRDLPKPTGRTPSERAKFAAQKRWEVELRVRDEERQRTKESARLSVGALSERELFLVGVALYWAEGSKDKSYARRETMTFVNSDPGMITTFLAWLDLMEVDRDRLRFAVMIHETADVASAEHYWADLVEAEPSAFYKTTLKHHNPKTVRKNVNEDYRGCLAIKVHKSADLYRRTEGAWCGIVSDASQRRGHMSV
ncbi:hypothetical protein [Streptomyces tsukubensis]|uniref:Resolvase n=1 Tax=Streptomyces tsukubensis TaxID=83656 RepID=A0A1V4A545_9ACTN|nr:hypothetical protein [Streptomyces tsukubensis]OON75946.1 hypothetical protein B1H18_21650 [Streptomyces tsukubensis]QFR94039.1 hypothetical protein GBW32_14430 [Streptomyces tsukubensis]